jgi:orotate phosphoribosyltransferase
MLQYQKDFLIHLIESKALTFEPAQLMSGRLSPYYVSMRTAVSDGAKASLTAEAYARKILSLGFRDIDYLHGPAYAGIPLVCLIATQLWKSKNRNLRWGYNRKEPKHYGRSSEEIIVGDFRDRDTVLIVDDVITTGRTKMLNWQMLCSLRRELKLKGILVAFDRQEMDEAGQTTSQWLKQEGVDLYSILNLTETLTWLHDREINGVVPVDDDVFEKVKNYVRRYGGETAKKLCL